SGGYGPVQNPQKRKEPFHAPRAKAGASSTHSKRSRAVAERLGLREAFGVRPACRRFPRFMVPMRAQKRQRTAAVQDASASEAAPLHFKVRMPAAEPHC